MNAVEVEVPAAFSGCGVRLLAQVDRGVLYVAPLGTTDHRTLHPAWVNLGPWDDAGLPRVRESADQAMARHVKEGWPS